jgi:hypothetical protein
VGKEWRRRRLRLTAQVLVWTNPIGNAQVRHLILQ